MVRRAQKKVKIPPAQLGFEKPRPDDGYNAYIRKYYGTYYEGNVRL